MALNREVFGTLHSFKREISPAAVEFVKRWEAFRATRYPDGKRTDGSIVYSIGYGHAEDGDNYPKKIPETMVLTEMDATRILMMDLKSKSHLIDIRVKVPLTSFMFEGLTSLCFQYGNGRLDKTEVFPLLNGENYIDAAIAMLELNTTKDGTVRKGLRLRRAAEVAWYLTKKG